MTHETASRQVRRAAERRAHKFETRPGPIEPGPVEQTSYRHAGRTKGLPFSRMTLLNVYMRSRGLPAYLELAHPTRRRPRRIVTATEDRLRVFFPSLPSGLRAQMLGRT